MEARLDAQAVNALQELERYREVVDDFDALVTACREPLPTTARVNTLRAEPRDLFRRLKGRGFHVEPFDWLDTGFQLNTDSPGNTVEHLLGMYHPQEEVSMIPPAALAPRPGDAVLDMCAAPGSKTSQLAAAMGNTGAIVANDVSVGRIKALKSNLERLGVLNARVTRYDGSRIPGSNRFDRVLLDPPCSAEGTCRKDPSALRNAERRREDLPGLQRALMRKSIDLLKPGGVMTYSTCTFAPEENEAIVAEGMRLGLEPVEMTGVPEGDPGLSEWRGTAYPAGMELCRRYYPHRVGGGGFFVAKLRKPGEGEL